MTLQGLLGDFSVGDVLQMMGQQQKTGVLYLSRNGGAEQVTVYFAKGQIVGVNSSTRDERERIGMLLLRARAINEHQLRRALKAHKKTGRRLGDVLLQQKVIDAETLQTFVQMQKCETLYQLFTWNNGQFSFEASQVVHTPADAMRSESVLLEGYRQLDEWPLIRAKIVHHTTSYAVIKALADVPAKRITPQVEKIYDLIQPERTVDTLIDISRLGRFETCKALWVLVETGVIREIAQDQSKTTVHLPLRSVTPSSRSAAPWLLLLLCLGVVGYGAWLRLHDVRSNERDEAGRRALIDLFQRF